MPFQGEQLFCLRWNNYQENIVEVFDKLLMEETFADVTLALDYGVNVRCHKMVLAACSTYFEGLFEELPCPHPIVVLKDISYSELKEVLEFMYTGEVQIAEDHLPQFVRVANVLQVKGLMAKSASLTISKVKPNNKQEDATSPSPSTSDSPSTSTTATTSPDPEPVPETDDAIPGPSSAPQSTTLPPSHGPKKPPKKRHQRPPPMWPMAPAENPSTPIDVAALQAALAHKHALYASSHYDNSFETGPSTSSRKRKTSDNNRANRNHDTPILRTVLGQGHIDNSIPHSHSDSHEYPSHSSDSTNYYDNYDARRSTMDRPATFDEQPSCSSYHYDPTMIDEDDRRPSPPSSSNKNAPATVTSHVQAQKPGWKRYKQYTPGDVSNAIEAVRQGMSALQAARKFSVPSRTLYDKVKKLGITTTRPFRRSSTCTSASFPNGIGCNVNGSIYANVSMVDNNNTTLLIDNPTSLLETTYGESRDESRDRESYIEAPRASRSPYQPIPLYAHGQTPIETIPGQETLDVTDQVQDLSINRRSSEETAEELSPNVKIKEEK